MGLSREFRPWSETSWKSECQCVHVHVTVFWESVIEWARPPYFTSTWMMWGVSSLALEWNQVEIEYSTSEQRWISVNLFWLTHVIAMSRCVASQLSWSLWNPFHHFSSIKWVLNVAPIWRYLDIRQVYTWQPWGYQVLEAGFAASQSGRGQAKSAWHSL